METGSIAISLLVGLCAAVAAFTNRANYTLLIDKAEHDLKDRLRSLRIATPFLRRWINIWLGIVAALFFILWLGADSLPVAMFVAPVMCAGPWFVIRRLAATRREKIEDQLADAMVMFSSGVRAGLSLAQSLELLANDCPKPIHQEFQQIIGEYKLGKPLERTLSEAKERLRSENFILFAAALLASRESGGRLNETVERISKSVLEIQRLERKVRAETAQARKSAVYMAIVMPLILLAYSFVDPQAVKALFETAAGQIILCIAVLLNIVAYLWALKLLRPDI
jgi:tight adherence protein B